MKNVFNKAAQTFHLNPLSTFKAITGVGIEKLIGFNMPLDTDGYYKALYNGGNFEDTEFRVSSLYGMPLADKWVDFEDKDGNKLVIECPVYRISRPRQITKTIITGLDHTIKEFIADGDFNIDMSFYIAANRPLDTNWEQLRIMQQFLALKEPFYITSAILNNTFNICKVVWTELADLSQHDTFNNIYVAQISMLGDEDYIPFEVEIEKKETTF
jgi:hypothetical protein